MSNTIKKFSAIGLSLVTAVSLSGAVMVLPAFGATVDELQAQITALLVQIQALQAQLVTTPAVSSYAFTKDLTLGSKGDDVKALQQFLNAKGYAVATTGAGSIGNETTTFGPLTKAALAKYQAAVGISPAVGYFGPKTKAYVASLAVAPITPVTPITPIVPTGTGITVAVDSSNPVATTLTKGSAGTDVLALKITSADADAILNSIKLKRTGVGLSTDYSNVYIYDGATRLKNGKSITSDTNTVEFTSINLAIPKGTSKVITVKVDVYTSATPSDINSIGIASASDISVTGGTVAGTFPISGNSMTIGSQSIGTVAIANGSSVSKPILGTSGAKLGNYRFTAGANDIEIKSLILVQNGSFANTGIKNLQLKYSGSVVASTTAMTGDKAVFTFATPYAITKSQNRTLELYADLSGGKTTDTIRFYIEETGDIQILDKQYGQNSAITNSIGSAAAYCVGAASNTCSTTGSLQGGAITLSDQGPTAATIRNNSTNIDLFRFNLTSSRNVTFKDYYVTLEQTAWDTVSAIGLGGGLDEVAGGEISAAGALTVFDTTVNDAANLAVGDVIKITDATQGNLYYVRMTTVSANTTGADSAGTVVASVIGGVTSYGAATTAATLAAGADDWVEIYDTHLRSYVKNVKLVDLTSGNVLASVSTSEPFISFTDDFDMAAGQTRNFAVRADLDTSLKAANALKAGVNFTIASTIKDNDANEYIVATDVVGGTTVGKIMTVGSASLVLARASTPVSTTIIKGMQNAEVLGISLTSGASSAAKLTEMTVRLFGDADTTFVNGEGDTAANTLVDSISLYKSDGSLLSGPKSLSLVGTIGSNGGYYKATFDGLSYDVAAGASQKLIVKANIKNTISATSYLAATVVPDADVVAQDAEGNVLTIALTADGGVNENDADATASNDTTPAVIMIVNTTGTLSASVEGAPSAGLVVAGATNVVMAKYKFNAVTDGYTINKLTIIADAADAFGTVLTTVDNNLVRVGVRYADGTVVWGNPTAGVTNISGLNIVVPKDTNNTYIEIVADLNTISGGATSGAAPRLGISEVQASTNTFNAVGAGSSETKDFTAVNGVAGTSNVYGQVVRKSVPTVAKAGTASSLLNGENTLYGFTVAADSRGAISLKRLALSTSFVADLNVSDLRFFRGASDITASVSIRNKLGQNLKTGGTSLVASGTPTSDVVYITWDKASTDEETISAGSSNTYYLKGTVSAAEAGDSFSTYIADDTAAMADGKVTTLRTTIAASPEAAAASVNNTAAIFRVEDATHVYLDADNNGIYEATTDYLITAVDATTPYLAVAGNADTIIPGALRWTGGSIGSGNAGAYFDIATTGDYDVASDPAFGFTASIDAEPAEDALIAFDIRYTTTGTTLYLDETDGGNATTAADVGTYNVGNDSVVPGADSVQPSTAPANNAYVRTLNANFIWSDQNNTSHAVSTADWMNGYLVSDLATASYTLSL